MKNLNFTVRIIAAAVLVQCFLLAGGLVEAQTCVGGGALSIANIPTGMTFPAMQTNISEDVINNMTTDGNLEFEDMRGGLLGFSLNIKATDFVDATNEFSFSVTNLKVASDDDDTIGLTACDDATGITLGELDFSSFEDPDENGESTEKVVASGDIRERIGKYFLKPEYQLTVPAGTPPGLYTATITFSII